MLKQLAPETIDALLSLAGPDSSCPITIIELRPLGGAFARAAKHPSAVEHVDAAYSVWTIIGGPPTATAPAVAYADQLLEGLAPWATSRRYINFMSDSDAEPTEIGYPSGAWERLRTIKRTVDPQNLFRLQHPIDPA